MVDGKAKWLLMALGLVVLAGCTTREKVAEMGEKSKKADQSPPVGISEPYTKVDGRWVPSRLVGVRCGPDGCKPYVMKESEVKKK